MTHSSKKILAVASGGGHWIQLMWLREAFDGNSVVFVGLNEMYRTEVLPHRFYAIPEVSRLHKWKFPITLLKLVVIFAKERPDIVITTGSAPGMLALRIGKVLGARTMWIDSIANVEEMSFSGRKARKYADVWLTQWPHLASEDGPTYLGRVL